MLLLSALFIGSCSGGGGASNGGGTTTTSVPQTGHIFVVEQFDGNVFTSSALTTYAVDPQGHLRLITRHVVSTTASSVAVDPAGRYAYVSDWQSNTISQYSVDAEGYLSPMSTATVTTGVAPAAIALDPKGRAAYVVSQNDSTIWQYSIGSDGSLQPMSTSTLTVGNTPLWVTVDPAGQFAYVAAANAHQIDQYTIGTDGSLSPITAAPTVDTGFNSTPSSIVVDPSGRFAYVGGFGVLSQFQIGADGALAAMSTPWLILASGAIAVTVDPGGHFLYATDSGDGNIYQYSIGTDGSLTKLSPATVPAGSYPISIMVDAAGKNVYVSNTYDNPSVLASGSVLQYTIGADGTLTPNTPGQVQTRGARAIAQTTGTRALQPDPGYVYVLNQANNTISQFALGANGTLTPLSPASVSVPIVTPEQVLTIAADPPGHMIYVSKYNTSSKAGTVFQFEAGADGTLTPHTGSPSFTAAKQPTSITFNPSGRSAYITDLADGLVSQYFNDPIEYYYGLPSGLNAMTPATVAAGVSPTTSVVDPTGLYAYVANEGTSASNRTINQYTIDPATSALSPMSTASVSVDIGIGAMAIDPGGKYLYAADTYTTPVKMYQYSIGTTGALSALGTASFDLGADYVNGMAVEPTGRYLYAISELNRILQYRIGSDGTLSALTPATIATGTNPQSISVDLSGQYVYVVNKDSNDIWQYRIGADGTLTKIGSPVAASGPVSIVATGRWQ
jgi:6-phosphogluconolactonase (cycloisomerase 2 family)